MAGTAPSEKLIWVIEQPGPWGRDAVKDSGLRPIADRVNARAEEAGARVQVVRRSTRRYRLERIHSWAADIEKETLARFEVTELEELLQIPFDAPASQVDPLELVCTHSTRDPCCARRGIPLHRAIRSAGGDVWHTSHLAGHRFAATMAVLPLGIWLGRVPAAEGPAVLEAVRERRIPLAYVRGFAGEPQIAQAAEIAIRRAESLDGVDDLEVQGVEGDSVYLTAADGRAWIVQMRHEPTGDVRPLSCGTGAKTEDPGRFVVVSIDAR